MNTIEIKALVNGKWLTNECKSSYFCQHHWYGRNGECYSYYERSREGSEFLPKETFIFGIGYFVES